MPRKSAAAKAPVSPREKDAAKKVADGAKRLLADTSDSPPHRLSSAAGTPVVAPVQTSETAQAMGHERLPAEVPLAYGDQLIDVIYGVHTSKLVFGVENGAGTLRPVQVVVLPTAALLIMASSIVRDLTSSAIVEETVHRLGGVVDMMRALGAPPVPASTGSTGKPRG
jgi:hypothetical protein